MNGKKTFYDAQKHPKATFNKTTPSMNTLIMRQIMF